LQKSTFLPSIIFHEIYLCYAKLLTLYKDWKSRLKLLHTQIAMCLMLRIHFISLFHVPNSPFDHLLYWWIAVRDSYKMYHLFETKNTESEIMP